jgi:hypothetical protein
MDFEPLLGGVLISLLVLYALVLGLAECLGRYQNWCGEAEKKARILLTQWLSATQLAQYENDRFFEVIGCDSGRRYRIRRDRQMNIDELDGRGARVAIWCFGPEGELPIGDIMLAQKIALETDEQAVLAVANRHCRTWYRT